MKSKSENAPIVYSTEHGRMCPACGKSRNQCICIQKSEREPRDGIVRIRREVKGRKGKTVTTISGLPLNHDGLQKIAKELKQNCGSGGSVKESVILIQGDHREKILKILQGKGYPVKKADG